VATFTSCARGERTSRFGRTRLSRASLRLSDRALSLSTGQPPV